MPDAACCGSTLMTGSREGKMRLHNMLALISTALACAVLPGQAQTNDFFGGQVPQSPPGAEAASQRLSGAGGGDYTDDEKRMQKKYKVSIARAKQLIARGDKMMKDGGSRHDDKMSKKGKIFKEIGEKQLTELQANNPFPNLMDAKKSAPGNKAGL